MLHQKHESYKHVLPLKNLIDWVTTRWEKKCHNLKNLNFEKKYSNFKKAFLPLMTIETSWAKKFVRPILETLWSFPIMDFAKLFAFHACCILNYCVRSCPCSLNYYIFKRLCTLIFMCLHIFSMDFCLCTIIYFVSTFYISSWSRVWLKLIF